MCFMHSFFFYLLIHLCGAKESVPTFILDYDHVMGILYEEQNPFATISSQDFNDMIEKSIKQYAVIILFMEENFSSEDISIKDDKGTPYANLREAMMKNEVKYLANVANPSKVLKQLLKPTQTNTFILRPGQLFHCTEEMQYFYVFFQDDVNETRIDALRRHDLVIQHVYETIRRRANGPVLGLYTGNANPVSVFTHETGALMKGDLYGQKSKGVILATSSALYRFVGMTVDSEDRTRRSLFEDEDFDYRQSLRPPPQDLKSTAGMVSKVRTGEEYALEFHFFFQSTRWRLSDIKLRLESEIVGELTLPNYIGAPYGQSYVCDEPLILRHNDGGKIFLIPKYQIQPFRDQDVQNLRKNQGTSPGRDSGPNAAQNAQESRVRITRDSDGKPDTRHRGEGDPYNRRGGEVTPDGRRGGEGDPYSRRGGENDPYSRRGGEVAPDGHRGGESDPYSRRGGEDDSYSRRGGEDDLYSRRGGKVDPDGRRGGEVDPDDRRRGEGEQDERRHGDGIQDGRRDGEVDPDGHHNGEGDPDAQKGQNGSQGPDARQGPDDPDADEGPELKFGPEVKCTPYFTIGIISGLAVTFLFLTIVTIGMFCLFHIHTNDRYDDPLAKQIQVPVGD